MGGSAGNITLPKGDISSFFDKPIPEVPKKVQKKFEGERKFWKSIPISELVRTIPEGRLIPLSNIPILGQAMGWPAYYKMSVNKIIDPEAGFGELSQILKGAVQLSPLVKVRLPVRAMLDSAQKLLDQDEQTAHLQLVVVDGYRSLSVQGQLFTEYKNYLAKQNPDWGEKHLEVAAQKMVSLPPKDMLLLRKSPPPHSTGGAVDVIFVRKDRITIESDFWLKDAMVDFGADFDEMMHPFYQDARSTTAFYEDKGHSEARANRRLLYHLLISVGFSNYFPEFWHYDFGSQFWAATTGMSEAMFGFAAGICEGEVIEDTSHETHAFQLYCEKYNVELEGTHGKALRRFFGF